MTAIFFGGVLAPALLMFGLTQASGATASLLLNLDAVLTALLACASAVINRSLLYVYSLSF